MNKKKKTHTQIRIKMNEFQSYTQKLQDTMLYAKKERKREREHWRTHWESETKFVLQNAYIKVKREKKN